MPGAGALNPCWHADRVSCATAEQGSTLNLADDAKRNCGRPRSPARSFTQPASALGSCRSGWKSCLQHDHTLSRTRPVGLQRFESDGLRRFEKERDRLDAIMAGHAGNACISAMRPALAGGTAGQQSLRQGCGANQKYDPYSCETESDGFERQQHVDCDVRAAQLGAPDRDIAGPPILERDLLRM
jgi:hypothetical protein